MTVQPDATRRVLINDLIKGLIADGAWPYFDGLYLRASHSDQAALLNVVSGTAFNATAINGWKDFVYRRVLRIIPPYWAATTLNLIILVALPSIVLHSNLDWQAVLKSYFLVHDYNSDGKVEPLLGVGWSLYLDSFFCAALA